MPSFLKSCQDIWSMPAENVVNEISLPFLALYLTVCTVSGLRPILTHS